MLPGIRTAHPLADKGVHGRTVNQSAAREADPRDTETFLQLLPSQLDISSTRTDS